MFQTFIPKIKTTLQSVTEIQEVKGYPTDKIGGYPCAIAIPTSFNNRYLTNASNLKGFSFTIFLLVEMEQLGRQQAYEVVMPELVDSVLTAFDNDWGFASILGSNRIWQVVDAGDWFVDNIDEGEVLVAELTLTINMSNDI